MHFRIRLATEDCLLPINYQYPLSAAIYSVLKSADADYAAFLHNSGYGKGFKLFLLQRCTGQF